MINAETARLAKEDRRQLLLSDSRVRSASSNPQEVKLCSGIKQLDEFLGGGLAFSALTEWSMPYGIGARRLMVSFLAAATTGAWEGGQKLWCLWVSARQLHHIYPPAWSAAGVALPHLRVARTRAPVRDLRALFIEDFFRVIVLDGPVGVSSDDCVFLSQQARSNRQLIVLLRDEPLSATNSNVAARLRLNTYPCLDRSAQDSDCSEYELECVRGVCRSSRTVISYSDRY